MKDRLLINKMQSQISNPLNVLNGCLYCDRSFINIATSPFLTLTLWPLFFYGWGSTASRLQPLRGGSLLFTIQFPDIPGTHFIDLGRMKG